MTTQRNNTRREATELEISGLYLMAIKKLGDICIGQRDPKNGKPYSIDVEKRERYKSTAFRCMNEEITLNNLRTDKGISNIRNSLKSLGYKERDLDQVEVLNPNKNRRS